MGAKLKSNNKVITSVQVISLACDEELVRLVFADGKELTIMPYDIEKLVDMGPRKDEGAEDPDDLDDVLDDDTTEFDDISDTTSFDDDDDEFDEKDDTFDDDDFDDEDDEFTPDPDKD